MNWDAISAIGEIIGAAAVVISLLYLAVQIRDQNKEARLLAMHNMSRELRDATRTFANEDITDIFVRANESHDNITEAESVRWAILSTNFSVPGRTLFSKIRMAILTAVYGTPFRKTTASPWQPRHFNTSGIYVKKITTQTFALMWTTYSYSRPM